MEIIGRNEFVVFPELSPIPVPAKIDTGAYRSALYAEVLTVKANQILIRAHFLNPEAPPECWVQALYKKIIRSSNGTTQERWLVRVLIQLGHYQGFAECSLADRKGLSYPVLIGRRLLRKRFLVDASKACLTGIP